MGHKYHKPAKLKEGEVYVAINTLSAEAYPNETRDRSDVMGIFTTAEKLDAYLIEWEKKWPRGSVSQIEYFKMKLNEAHVYWWEGSYKNMDNHKIKVYQF